MTKWLSKSGRPYVDNRDWTQYNEHLVVQGEFLLDIEWIKNGWEKELTKMNNRKRGAPYRFPNSLIELQAVWHQWLDYREIEGITRQVVRLAQLPQFNDYSTINRRVNALNIEFELPKSGFISLATDGSGFKQNNAGEYREDKYGKKKRKKYIKVVITANPYTKELLACTANIEGQGPSEPECAQQHIQRMVEKGIEVVKFWGDGSFDVIELFNFLERNNTEAAIKIRSNASNKAHGSMRRAREVAEYQSQNYADWAREKEYGKRWLGTEVIFSAVKRKFGEKIRARRVENMLLEAKRKFWAYQKIRKYSMA